MALKTLRFVQGLPITPLFFFLWYFKTIFSKFILPKTNISKSGNLKIWKSENPGSLTSAQSNGFHGLPLFYLWANSLIDQLTHKWLNIQLSDWRLGPTTGTDDLGRQLTTGTDDWDRRLTTGTDDWDWRMGPTTGTDDWDRRLTTETDDWNRWLTTGTDDWDGLFSNMGTTAQRNAKVLFKCWFYYVFLRVGVTKYRV